MVGEKKKKAEFRTQKRRKTELERYSIGKGEKTNLSIGHFVGIIWFFPTEFQKLREQRGETRVMEWTKEKWV